MITDTSIPQVGDILRSYGLLTDRVDAWSAERTDRFGSRLACTEGCAGCCQRALSVTALEAAIIGGWLDEHGLAEPRPGEAYVDPLAVLDESEGACVMLDEAGRCRIYAVRPLICRTHGLPLAVPDDDGALHGDVCPLSFEGGAGLVDLASTDFLDVTTLNVVLATLDLEFTRRVGLPAGERTALTLLVEEAS